MKKNLKNYQNSRSDFQDKITASIKQLKKPLFAYSSKKPSRPKGTLKKLLEQGLVSKQGKGLYSFHGIAAELIIHFDAVFKEIATEFSAVEQVYSATVNPRILKKAGYFENFAQIIKFTGSRTKEDISDIHSDLIMNKDLHLEHCLLPAACLPCYEHLGRQKFIKDPTVITTCNTIFRKEKRHPNLFTMDEFMMREVVFLGTTSKVKAALERSLERVKQLAIDLDFSFQLNLSTDLFYGTSSQEKTLFQLLNRSKIELRGYASDLDKYIPITSINYHDAHFGRSFKIKINKETARTGCLAFGLQRWVLMFLSRHGADQKKWPRNIKRILS